MGDEEFTKYCEEMKTQRLFHIKHSFFCFIYKHYFSLVV